MIDERTLLIRMRHHGGAFAKALATAWLLADSRNAARLREHFQPMLEPYRNVPDPPESDPPERARRELWQGGHLDHLLEM